MIHQNRRNNLIYREFSQNDQLNWFDLKEKKFLNTIDTLYYSVFCSGDFSYASKDKKVLKYRRFWDKIFAQLRIFEDFVLDSIPGLPYYFLVRRIHFGSGTYEICLSRPDFYDILLTKYTANSMTSQVLVQLRSKALWMDGVKPTLDVSLQDVKIILDYFGFQMIDVKENRVDYCWHSNYLQAPEEFFLPSNFAKMRLSRLSSSNIHVEYRGNESYEIDYVTLGKKVSKNVFFRIYLKSKEVVEKGYKAFFLKKWFFAGMISRYDLYCYEYAYSHQNWNYLILGRLAFYQEYGADVNLRLQCSRILSGELKYDYDDLKCFADMLTPPVTLVVNVEYQTMRKFSASLVLPNSHYNIQKYGVYSRLYDVLDNYRLICNYLTQHCVRLVQPYGDDNKSRREDCPFWSCLRRTRAIDGKNAPADSVALRQYDHERNASIVKKRILGGIASYNLYYKGSNADASELDLIDFITSLNDNDFEDMRRLKQKKMKRSDYTHPLAFDESSENGFRFSVLDNVTGEIFLNPYKEEQGESKNE